MIAILLLHVTIGLNEGQAGLLFLGFVTGRRASPHDEASRPLVVGVLSRLLDSGTDRSVHRMSRKISVGIAWAKTVPVRDGSDFGQAQTARGF